MNDDDEILALIDVQRPSSRKGRKRSSRTRKTVKFADDIKPNVGEDSKHLYNYDGLNHDEKALSKSAGTDVPVSINRDVNETNFQLRSFSSDKRKFDINNIDGLFRDNTDVARTLSYPNVIDNVPSETKTHPRSQFIERNIKVLSTEENEYIDIDSSNHSRQNPRNVVVQEDVAGVEAPQDHMRQKKMDQSKTEHHEVNEASPVHLKSKHGINVPGNDLNHLQNPTKKVEGTNFYPQTILTSHMIDEIMDKLKESFDTSQNVAANETQQKLVSSLREKSDSDTQHLNTMMLKLDGVIKKFKMTIDTDNQKIREDQCRLSKMQEALDEERKNMTNMIGEERRILTEERVAFEKWRDQINNDLRKRRIYIEDKEELTMKSQQKAAGDLQSLEHMKKTLILEEENLQQQSSDLRDQRERIDTQYEELNRERITLQDMAEQISALSKKVVERSQTSEEIISEARRKECENAKEFRSLAEERKKIAIEKLAIENEVEMAKHRKMDLARQRVDFLKHKIISQRNYFFPTLQLYQDPGTRYPKYDNGCSTNKVHLI